MAMGGISFLGIFLTIFSAVFLGSVVGSQYNHHHPHQHHYHHPIGTTTWSNVPALGCQDVFNNFDACEAYIVGDYSDPPYQCCNGLIYLNNIAKKEYGGARRICQCIENIAASRAHYPYSEQRIENLYYRCDIHLSFPISERMDCSRVYD